MMSDERVISCKTEVNAVKVILLLVLGLKTRRFADVMSGQQRNFWSIKHLVHLPKLDVVAEWRQFSHCRNSMLCIC